MIYDLTSKIICAGGSGGSGCAGWAKHMGEFFCPCAFLISAFCFKEIEDERRQARFQQSPYCISSSKIVLAVRSRG